MSARSRPSSPSTTHGSISHDSSDDAFDIPERLRLHRQMSLELGHPSYASSTGEHEEDDTVGSFDIEGGAGAMSTMHRFQNMLPQQSPSVLDSKIINGHFADFTMDGVPIMPDYSENSIEIGRNNSKLHSSRQMSTTPKGPYKTSAANNSSYLGVGSAAAARRNIRAASKQVQQSKAQPSKQKEQERVNVESQSRQPFSIDGDESTVGSIDRPQSALNTRFVGQPKKPTAGKRIPSIAVQPEVTDMLIAAAQEANTFPEGRRSAPPATSVDQQGTVRRNIPSGFKSAQEFLGELGLKPSDTPEKAKETHNKSKKTQQQRAANMNTSLSRAPASKPAAPNSTYQSFRLPDMTGISDLVSGYTNNEHSTQMDIAHHHALHRPIESIPLPQDEKAILLALNMLQEKVKMLEEQKAHDEKRQADLEDNLEHTKQLYSIEAQGRRAAEAELHNQKRADSALGTDNDSERGGWSEDRERLQTKKAIERMKLDNTITTQRQMIENLEQKLQVTKIELRNITEERNNIVTSLAATVSAQEGLREENSYLKSEVDRLQRLLQDHDSITSDEIMKLEAKITRYRQKVKRSNDTAKEATTTAREAMRLLRASRSASTEVKGQPSAAATSSRAANVAAQQKVHTHTHTQKKQPTKAQEVERRHISTERKPSSSKPSASAPAPAPATKSSEQTSRPRRKKVILQEVSESEDEIDVTIGPAFVADAPEEESMHRHQYNDTTFTEPDKENMEPSNMSIRVPDETLISAVDDDEIALLRAQIEEERMLCERKSATSKKSQQRQKQRAVEPERDTAPEEAQNPSGAAKQKRVFIYCPDDGELTVSDIAESQPEEFGADEEEDVPAPQPAQQVSDHIQEVIDNLGTHDEMRCTVCRRKAEVEFCKDAGRVANIEHPANLEGPIAPEEVVPVSQRMPAPAPATEEKPWEEEPTMRPSVAPKAALEKVLQQLQDEFNHLKLDYDSAQTEFLGLDPSLGKRRRKSLTMKMNEMVEELDRKADQIYALYDVAELTHNNNVRVATAAA